MRVSDSFVIWWIGIWVMVGLLAWGHFGSIAKGLLSVWVPVALGVYWLRKKAREKIL